MIYGDLIEKSENSAIYLFGTATDDITGEVVFYKDLRMPDIIKYPSGGKVSEVKIFSLPGKYKNSFSKGIFPEKISYEIG